MGYALPPRMSLLRTEKNPGIFYFIFIFSLEIQIEQTKSLHTLGACVDFFSGNLFDNKVFVKKKKKKKKEKEKERKSLKIQHPASSVGRGSCCCCCCCCFFWNTPWKNFIGLRITHKLMLKYKLLIGLLYLPMQAYL